MHVPALQAHDLPEEATGSLSVSIFSNPDRALRAARLPGTAPLCLTPTPNLLHCSPIASASSPSRAVRRRLSQSRQTAPPTSSNGNSISSPTEQPSTDRPSLWDFSPLRLLPPKHSTCTPFNSVNTASLLATASLSAPFLQCCVYSLPPFLTSHSL